MGFFHTFGEGRVGVKMAWNIRLFFLLSLTPALSPKGRGSLLTRKLSSGRRGEVK
jgi:hypothetical protein